MIDDFCTDLKAQENNYYSKMFLNNKFLIEKDNNAVSLQLAIYCGLKSLKCINAAFLLKNEFKK